MDIMDDDTIEINLETIKQISYGGALGLLAGYACKKAQFPVLLSTAGFVLYRWAIYDGYVKASVSPLAIDDSSLTR
jgi:uncharacterized membrane protein (Fun14 family)